MLQPGDLCTERSDCLYVLDVSHTHRWVLPCQFRELFLTAQKTPRMAPLMSANRIVTPNELAGIQTAKQAIPHASVSTAATLILPK